MLSLARSASLAAAALLAVSAQAADVEQVALRGAPARVAGMWCGAGALSSFTLQIAQRVERFEAQLVRKGRVREITGRIDGALVRTDPQRDETLELLARGNELRIVGATGPLALLQGQFFTRAAGGSCPR
ncbi:MAG TPA: hypothetical protein VHL79_13290 [Ramlibacter sp.]|jgi:hypothetical protein|nr:hypothetical protein [Ramlibacter sp.]